MLNHPSFQSRPTRGQLAKGGVWEEAWRFHCANVPGLASVREYLAGGSEVAFEAFFGQSFLGLRFTGEPNSVENFARVCLDALRLANSGEDFFARLSNSMSLCRWAEQISFAEIGAINAWRTVGAFRIPDLQAASVNFRMLWSAVNA